MSKTFQPGEMIYETEHLRLRACRHGPVLYNAHDIYVGGSFDAYGEFSEGETALFAQMLKPGMTVLDIGANIGAHTVPMARMVGAAGRVVAFEPQRMVFQMLCANLALNGIGNVQAHWAALGRAPGQILVPPINYEVTGNFGGVSLGHWQMGEEVRCITIDSLALPACHVMKIDVEGMEAEVLAGAGQTIARHRPILYVENDREAKSKALLEAMLALGYRLWWHLPHLYSSANAFGNEHNLFPGIRSINVLAIPKERPVNILDMAEITSPEANWREALAQPRAA